MTFISFITFNLFFKESVNVSITANCDISGQKRIEYQKVAKSSDYSETGTWTEGSSFNVTEDEKIHRLCKNIRTMQTIR